MSGGSWDYVFRHFEETAERLATSPNPRRVALGTLVAKIAVAMRDIEWVDSCDSAPGDEHAAIDAVVSRAEVLAAASDRLAREIEHAAAVFASLSNPRET